MSRPITLAEITALVRYVRNSGGSRLPVRGSRSRAVAEAAVDLGALRVRGLVLLVA